MAGEILKQRREELGLNLKEIAKTLRIRYDYLKAVEDEVFEKLPVEVYAKGYIREYARFLKVDPEPVINAYIKKMSPPATEKTEIKPEKGFKVKLLPIAITVLTVIAVAYITAYLIFPHTQKKTEVASPQKPMIAPQPVTSATEKKDRTDKPAEEQKIVETSSPPQREEAKEYILEIFATDTTWLLINIDDTQPKDMLLKLGESLKLSAKKNFTLKIGNAGGVKLVFNGKEIGPYGNKGEVVTLNLLADRKPATEQYHDN